MDSLIHYDRDDILRALSASAVNDYRDNSAGMYQVPMIIWSAGLLRFSKYR